MLKAQVERFSGEVMVLDLGSQATSSNGSSARTLTPYTGIVDGVFVLTHNKNITQADVLLARYKVTVNSTVGTKSYILGDTHGDPTLWGGTVTGVPSVSGEWSASDPADPATVTFQANTLKVKLGTAGNTMIFNIIIEDLYGTSFI